MKKPQLTERQYQMMNVIWQYWVANGHAPTFREIGATMGIASTNGVKSQVRALVAKRFLIQSPGKDRALWPADLRDKVQSLAAGQHEAWQTKQRKIGFKTITHGYVTKVTS